MSKMRMDAYYFWFTPTGVREVDLILSAVACAGKAFHSTEYWTDDSPLYNEAHRGSSPAEWIQNSATDAANVLTTRDAVLREVREAVGELPTYEPSSGGGMERRDDRYGDWMWRDGILALFEPGGRFAEREKREGK